MARPKQKRSLRLNKPSQVSKSSKRCYFLTLPTELRNQIYSYILPTTVQKRNRTVWERGETSILATNHQIYEEASNWLYGENVFALRVTWDDGPEFRQTYPQTAQGKGHRIRTQSFPDCFAARNVRQIRKYNITLYQVTRYTGVLKYNHSGRGLGLLRDQVDALCKILEEALALQTVRFKLIDAEGNTPTGHTVLDPLRRLRNVRQASIAGSTPSDYAMDMKEIMESSSSSSVSS